MPIVRIRTSRCSYTCKSIVRLRVIVCVYVLLIVCIRAILHVYENWNCSYTGTGIVRIREHPVCIRVFWSKCISICTSTNAYLRKNLRLYNVPLRRILCLYTNKKCLYTNTNFYVEAQHFVRNSCSYTNIFCSYTNTNFYVEAQHVVPLRRIFVRLQSASTSKFAPLRVRLYVESCCSYTNFFMFVYKHKFDVEARIEM